VDKNGTHMTSRVITSWVLVIFLLPGISVAGHDAPEIPKDARAAPDRGIANGGLLWRRLDTRKDRPKVLLYFPTLVQGAAVIYNLPGTHDPVCITGETLADIFSGQITRWNDDHIVATNPNVRLPKARIRLLDRGDENGMSWLLSRYLTQVSESWATRIGASPLPSWPIGQSVPGERQLITRVRETPYAIGFADFYSVRSQSVSRAAIQNKAGICQMPSLESLAAAAMSAAPYLQFESSLDAINNAAPGAYPITGFSGLIVASYEKSDKKTVGIADLLRYILTDGQKLAADSGYVALPPKLVELELQALSLLRPH
jgi:phosphate transport system substrate-binding protein